MNRKMYKARVTTSFALAHLAKEVVDEDWSAATAAFRLRVLVGENVGALHRMRARLRRVAARRQDEPIRRALAILDVAVGKPNEVMPIAVREGARPQWWGLDEAVQRRWFACSIWVTPTKVDGWGRPCRRARCCYFATACQNHSDGRVAWMKQLRLVLAARAATSSGTPAGDNSRTVAPLRDYVWRFCFVAQAKLGRLEITSIPFGCETSDVALFAAPAPVFGQR